MNMPMSDTQNSRLGARQWIALSVLLIALAMSMFDVAIVNLILPSVTESLDASSSTLSWLVAGYLLGYGLSLVPAGRAGDRYGHKSVFITGVAAYLVTGIMVCLANSEALLVVSRVLHGLAGGIMIAPIAALIHIMFDGVSKVRAFGYFSAMTGLGALVGPVIGGQVLDAVGPQDGWRWAMAIGLPLGVIALILAVPYLPNTTGAANGAFDLLGILLLSIVVVGLIAPLTQGLPEWGWISVGIAAVVLVLFILWERSVDRRGGTPLLQLHHFRKLPFSLGLLQTVLGFAAFTSPIYIAMATLWQWGRGESALQAALVMLTFALGAIIGGVIDDRFTVWFDRWDIMASLALLVGGYIVTYAMLVSAAAEVHLLVVSIPLLFAGIGAGAFIGLNMSTVLSAVSPEDAGSVAGLIVTMMRLGSAFGAAVILYVTALPAAAGVDEATRWVNNGVYGVLGCTVFAAIALLLAVIVYVRGPRAASAALAEAVSTPVSTKPADLA